VQKRFHPQKKGLHIFENVNKPHISEDIAMHELLTKSLQGGWYLLGAGHRRVS
jgi:hypothetical protein